MSDKFTEYPQYDNDTTTDCDDCEARIRAGAIEEFINKISESIIWDILAEIMKRNIGASEGADRIIEYLQKVAEQLKEQSNGES